MILRHYQILHRHNARPPLTHAGRFWIIYLIGVALVAAWVIS